jgi:hypothetical protein
LFQCWQYGGFRQWWKLIAQYLVKLAGWRANGQCGNTEFLIRG